MATVRCGRCNTHKRVSGVLLAAALNCNTTGASVYTSKQTQTASPSKTVTHAHTRTQTGFILLFCLSFSKQYAADVPLKKQNK